MSLILLHYSVSLKTNQKNPKKINDSENLHFISKKSYITSFSLSLPYCRDIHSPPMSDILITLRGPQFHHSLMWEIWTGGLLATTRHYSYVFLSYYCAKRLAVGEGLEKASVREEKRWRGSFVVRKTWKVDAEPVVTDEKCFTKGP